MGISILNEDLRECYENAVAIHTMLDKELKQVNGNKIHLDKLVPEDLKGKYSGSMKTALEFKQRILRDAFKAGVILLTATFERIAFAKYRTSSGEMVAYIEKAKDLSIEYDVVKDKFIKTSLSRLKELIELFEGHIETKLYEKLEQIREQRNSYAHGNPNSIPIVNDYSLDDIVVTFDEILTVIEKRPASQE